MPFPAFRSANYNNLSFNEKIKFVKECCESRKALFQKMNAGLFGNKPSIYLSMVNAIIDYLDAVLKKDLDECFKVGLNFINETYPTKPRTPCYPPMQWIDDTSYGGIYQDQKYAKYLEITSNWDKIKAHPLTENDLDFAYTIINHRFLSNNEFYRLTFRELKKLEIDNQKLDQEKPFLSFYFYLSGTLVDENKKWKNLFSNSKQFDDIPSEKIRPAIKITAALAILLAIPTASTKNILSAASLFVIGTGLYKLSGPLADTLATKFYGEEPAIKSMKPR